MRYKLLLGILTVVCSSACLFGFAACDAGNDEEHSHEFSSYVSDGELTHTSTCNCSQTQTENHTWSAWAKSDDNNHTRTCTVCHETQTESHTWSAWAKSDDNNHTRTCTVCHETQSEPHNMQNVVCSVCNFNIPATITDIKNGSVDYANSKIFMVVDKTTETLNLSNSITASGTWKLFENNTEIPNKTITPAEGDNKYTIVVSEDNKSNSYEFTLHKSYEVTLSFYNAYNAAFKYETVNSGYEYEISFVPEFTGYTFNYWEIDGVQAEKFVPYENTKIKANCTANSYLFTLDVNGGNALSIETKYITFDTSYSLPVPERTGYTFAGWYNQAVMVTGADGESLFESKYASDVVLKANWLINNYTVTATTENEAFGSVSGSGSFEYNSEITLIAVPNLGYNFAGWFNGENKISEELIFLSTLGAQNIEYTAKFEPAPEMAPFIFTSSATYCAINGIHDKTVTEISIPDYVTIINKEAFIDCSLLENITFPNSVTHFGLGILKGCTSLKSLTLPFVGDYIGYGNDYNHLGFLFGATEYRNNPNYVPESLKTVQITGTKKLGAYIFYNCDKITGIILPDSLTNIGNYAFYGCQSLADITIPNSVTDMGAYAFDGCKSFKSIKIPEGVTSLSSGILYGCSSLTEINLPDSLTEIGTYALDGCTSLVSIAIPEKVTEIAGYAFYNCTSLKNITIPEKVTTISENTFYGCSALENLVLHEKISVIGNLAFCRCSSLTDISIPDGIKSIGSSAFSGCTNLKFKEYDNAYYIGNEANPYVALISTKSNVITSCTVQETAKIIADGVFEAHNSLKSVHITDGLEIIGQGAFKNCTVLESVIVSENNKAFSSQDGILYNKDKTRFMLVPLAIKGQITIPEGITTIGYEMFKERTSLEGVTLPNSVTAIGGCAFDGCSALRYVTLPSGLESIGSYAFRNCRLISNFTFKGTTQQWDQINLGYRWAYKTAGNNITDITCTNGTRYVNAQG